MPTGVRDKEALKALGLSNRMMARVGALLAKRLDITAAVLETAASGGVVASLLFSKELLDSAESLAPKAFAEMCKKAAVAAEAELRLHVSGEWRTILLDEETAAEGAFAAASDAQEAQGRRAGALAVIGASGAMERSAPAISGVDKFFTQEEIKRLELIVVTSAEPKQKIEAMRRLSYSPLPAGQRGEMLIRALAADSPEVRVEAAELLVGLGLGRDLADAIRELYSPNEKEKLFAIERIARLMLSGSEMDVGSGLVSLVSGLRHGESPQVLAKMLDALKASAALVALRPERISEVIRIAAGLLAAEYEKLCRPVRMLLRALGAASPEATETALWAEHGKTPPGPMSALLLAEIGSLPTRSDEDRLAKALAAEMVRYSPSCGIDYHMLGDRLMTMGDRAIQIAADAFDRAGLTIKRYLLIVVNDVCRYRNASPGSVLAAGEFLARVLETADAEVRVGALASQVPWRPELPPELRRRMAEAFLGNIHLLSFPSEVEDAEYTVARMGFAAVEPLVTRLGEAHPSHDRIRASRILGDLCRVARRGEGSRQELERILRELHAASLAEFPNKGVVFVAMAKLACSFCADREIVSVVERAVIERQGEEGVGNARYEALGWLASAPCADQKHVQSIVAMFQGVLNTEPPEIQTELNSTDDGNLFEVGSQAEFYTEVIPEAIRGLRRVALGSGTSRDSREEITSYLVHKWMAMVSGHTVWGPGNAGEMVEALRAIGADATTPVSTRLKILRSLAKRISQPPVQMAIATILESDDSSQALATYASSAALAMLKRKDEFDELESDDRQHFYEVLGKIASRVALDETDAKAVGLRKRLADVISEGLRDRMPGCYEVLVRLREKKSLPEYFRDSVAARLKAYEQVELYSGGS